MKKYLTLVIGLGILVAIAVVAPWGKIIAVFSHISWIYIYYAAALALIYYGAKIVRFWTMLRLLGVKRNIVDVSLTYLAAQPVSLLPAGELYRTVLLKKYCDVPIETSAPTVTLQSLIEAVVLVGFSLVGAFALNRDRAAVVIAAIMLLAILVGLRRGWFKRTSKLVDVLPFISISRRKFEKMLDDHKRLLKLKSILPLIALSLIPVLAGIGIFMAVTLAVGAKITWAQASIGYCLPVIVSGLSFLPGGLGASEGGTIGILRIIGISSAVAIAITLLARLFTLGTGLVLGLVSTLACQLRFKS